MKRLDCLSLYINAVLIGFWVFFKWFVSYLWFMVHSNSIIRTKYVEEKSEGPAQHKTSNRPPPFVVDNYFGRHSYIKTLVSVCGDVCLGISLFQMEEEEEVD